MTATSTQRKLSARDDLLLVEIDGELVVLDRSNGMLHHLNASASAVLRACDGTATAADLSRDLAQAFGAPLAEVTRDLGVLILGLGEAGLLRAPQDPDGGCADCGGSQG